MQNLHSVKKKSYFLALSPNMNPPLPDLFIISSQWASAYAALHTWKFLSLLSIFHFSKPFFPAQVKWLPFLLAFFDHSQLLHIFILLNSTGSRDK